MSIRFALVQAAAVMVSTKAPQKAHSPSSRRQLALAAEDGTKWITVTSAKLGE